MRVIRRLQERGRRCPGGRAERRDRARSRRPRLRARPGRRRASSGEPREPRRDAPFAAACSGLTMLRVEELARSTRAARFDRTPTFTLRGRLHAASSAIVGVMGRTARARPRSSSRSPAATCRTSGDVVLRGPGHPPGALRRALRGSRCTTTSATRCARSASACRRSCWSARGTSAPIVHLFDEPQFSPQDGYIGFMLDFFRRLKGEGKLVFVLPAPERAVPHRAHARGVRAVHLREQGAAPRTPLRRVPRRRRAVPGVLGEAGCLTLAGYSRGWA